MTLIHLGDEMAGTARLARLYVALEGMKLPAAFCKFAVKSCAGDVALIRQSAVKLHPKQTQPLRS